MKEIILEEIRIKLIYNLIKFKRFSMKIIRVSKDPICRLQMKFV